MFVAAGHGIDIGKIELWIDALRVQIECQRDEINVACPLTVAKQATLDTVGAGHQRQLRRRHGRASVVVRVQTENHAVAARQMTMHPFDLIGIDIGCRHFDRRRQVENHLARRRCPPRLGDGVAHLQREIEFSPGEMLGAVFKHPFGTGIFVT